MQRLHNLSSRGILLYLLVSILSLWLLILSFTNVFLVMNWVRWKTRDLYVFGCSIGWFPNKWGVNQIFLHGGAFSSSEVLGKNTSIQSKLLTLKLAGLKRKERKVWSKPHLCASGNFSTTCKSKYSSPVEALQCNHSHLDKILRQILK